MKKETKTKIKKTLTDIGDLVEDVATEIRGDIRKKTSTALGMYPKEEVERLCRKALFEGRLIERSPKTNPYGKTFEQAAKSWLKENLK